MCVCVGGGGGGGGGDWVITPTPITSNRKGCFFEEVTKTCQSSLFYTSDPIATSYIPVVLTVLTLILDDRERSPPVLLSWTVTVPTSSLTVISYTLIWGTAANILHVFSQ